MKIWQISAVLSEEMEIFKEHFPDVDLIIQGREDADEERVTKALKKSKVQYCITSDNYLRLMIEKSRLKELNIQIVEIISAFMAYKRFGGDIITEVVDYGSFDLSK